MPVLMLMVAVMSSYISYEQLMVNPGLSELADIATPKDQVRMDEQLLAATLKGTDRSAWTVEEIAEADTARQRIFDAMTEAQALVNSYLYKAELLPLSEVPATITTWTRAIIRYYLHQDRFQGDENDPVVVGYKEAKSMLAQVADGTFSLGIETTTTPEPSPLAAGPAFTPGLTVMRDALRDY